MREVDEAATNYWKLAASDRDKGYELWMKKVKKVSEFIDVFKKRTVMLTYNSFLLFCKSSRIVDTSGE